MCMARGADIADHFKGLIEAVNISVEAGIVSGIGSSISRQLLGLGLGACIVLSGIANAQTSSSLPVKINDTASSGTASTALETVADFDGAMPTGVTVSKDGRIFVCYPRWGDDVKFTVAEIKNGKASAYPNQEFNTTHTGARQANGFVSVQSVVVDPSNRLWALDTGSIKLGPVSYGGPKLVCFDLSDDSVTTRILIPPDVALETTYLNDVRFDLRRGQAGLAFITDSSSKGPGGIIVVDLATGRSWRTLSGHPSTMAQPGFVPVVEGKKLMKQPTPQAKPEAPNMAADGIAVSADGERLYYCALITRKLYSVSLDALENAGKPGGKDPADTVHEEKPRAGASDGLESDAEGRLYFTDYEHHSVVRRNQTGKDTTIAVVKPNEWPDTLSISNDGYLYIMANQLHRQPAYNAGKDMRVKPYHLYRQKIDAKPVQLK